MRKVFALFLLVCACGLVALAQSAEKAAASSATTILFRTPTVGNVPDAGSWVTVLHTSIKPPGGKDLFIGVSAVTEVENLNLNLAPAGLITSSFASGEIVMRVLVDGVPATPGVVVFDDIQHSVTTLLSSQLGNCTEVDIGPNTGKVTCASTPGLLDTLFFDASANSFNFIMQDVSPGSAHDIQVQAQFFASSSFNGTAEVIMGARTVTLEEVALDAQ